MHPCFADLGLLAAQVLWWSLCREEADPTVLMGGGSGVGCLGEDLEQA